MRVNLTFGFQHVKRHMGTPYVEDDLKQDNFTLTVTMSHEQLDKLEKAMNFQAHEDPRLSDINLVFLNYETL